MILLVNMKNGAVGTIASNYSPAIGDGTDPYGSDILILKLLPFQSLLYIQKNH